MHMSQISKNMNCEIPPRPHTVGGSMPKTYLQSDFIMQLLHQIENEAKGPPSHSKPPQKNYMKENVKKLKEIQAQSKQRISEKQPLQPLRVPNKYCEVHSKVSKAIHPNTDGFVNEIPCTSTSFQNQAPLSPCSTTKTERQSPLQTYKSLPQLSQVAETEQGPDELYRDIRSSFGSARSDRTAHSIACSRTKHEGKPVVRHRPGQIPNYLTERKKQWELEKEKEKKMKEAAAIPYGYTLLPDEERHETLELLKKNQEELIQSLATLPVRNDTIKLRNYKGELERQLAKVEEGIKIFSRPKVLIKNDT